MFLHFVKLFVNFGAVIKIASHLSDNGAISENEHFSILEGDKILKS
jgi:hypothetical protein